MSNFTKKDLISGDILVSRDGPIGLVVVGMDNSYRSIIWSWKRGGTIVRDLDEEITESLESADGIPGHDIVKVYRPAQVDHMSTSPAWYDQGFLKYDRDKVVVEMTMEEVCKALGKNIKIVKEK